jgi:hypothetical protein
MQAPFLLASLTWPLLKESRAQWLHFEQMRDDLGEGHSFRLLLDAQARSWPF